MAKYRLKSYTPELMQELAYISKNLRYYTKYWQMHFGSLNRDNMRNWEVKMDKWLFDNLLNDDNDNH